MPFVRVSRDKRGYEQISLMHASSRRGKPTKPRVLYVFRTPPGIKIGREPFDASVRREIEAQNPEVQFDWVKLSNIPVPSPDVEFWRERRRAEKAAKQARREAELEETQAESPEEAGPSSELQPAAGIDPSADSAAEDEALEKIDDEIDSGSDVEGVENGEAAIEVVAVAPPEAAPGDARPVERRRRRRRGGRRRHQRPAGQTASSGNDPAQSGPSSGAEPAPKAPAASEPSKVSEDPSKEA